MSEALKVEKREAHGKRNNRGLRNAGSVPVVLYGHGEQTLSLKVAADQLAGRAAAWGAGRRSGRRGQGKGLHPRAAMGSLWNDCFARRLDPRFGR